MKEIAKNFDAKQNETSLYEKWEKDGYFNPDNLVLEPTAPNYTIVLPPPNITDKLHLGHSAMLAIEDLFIRYHRMNGYRTLWLPGTDHAAIATQTVVEKKIQREEGKTRHQLGREVFLEKVWEFLGETQATILNQIRKMGASLDWSRLAFTLDEPRQRAVQEMFIRMYNDGLIYRGERIVNWCPRCHSTLADDEVEYIERAGKLYTFKYSADFPMAISTTRPETKLGDTAVAVNPKDERYKKYIGQIFEVNFCGVPLKIKIIADWNVDMEFGTGAVGVTPAHSMVDWAMGQANDLPIVKVINEEANIQSGFGEFSGLSSLAAREKIVEMLKTDNLMISEEDLTNNLSVCYRCNTPIEPLPSKQWFVAVDKPLARLGDKSLKQCALEAAKNKEIEFIPDRFEKKYTDWMTNLKDWCISRQIWFGHSIPVWYKGEEIFVGTEAPIGEAWIKDQDTLDTWFSSGMWTFSTLGWPDNFKTEKLNDLAKFHPTQVLETGYEIITLWVSRMIMMSYYAIGEIPFEKVYLHGMVLDKNGKKMSKSKGNGIDPLDMIEKYGADAVRLALTTGTTPGNDVKFYEEKIEVARNFVNKLWNIARFILGQLPDKVSEINKADLTLADAWILSRLENVKAEVSSLLEKYDFSVAGEILKIFTWDELADWYLEASKFIKSESSPAVLKKVLTEVVAMWHPFIPFVTETIWRELDQEKALIISNWPTKEDYINLEAEKRFDKVKEIIIAIRNVRSENKIEPSKKLPAMIVSADSDLKELATLITSLKTGLASLEFVDSYEAGVDAIYAKTAIASIWILGATDATTEKDRITKEIANLEKLVNLAEKKLANEDFVANAPRQLVDKEREKLDQYRNVIADYNNQLIKLS
ncbi:MAG: valine--tRNA ligase [Patescibacteria group bacterium]|nr:valine--tRNA ligase [Patescibacteria group bacterium]